MEVHFAHVPWLSADEREEIQEKLRALAAEGQHDLIDVRILGNPSRHKGHTDHEIRITCEARGKEIVAVQKSHSLNQALHDALESLRQQVRRMRKKRRDHGHAKATPVEE